MLPGLAFILLFASADQIIRPPGEQPRLAVVVNSPTRKIAGLSISEIIALADDAASPHLDVVELDGGSCLEPGRSRELFHCLANAGIELSGPRFVLLLSIRAVAEGDRVSGSLIDLDQAERALHSSDEIDELEARIIDDAIPAHTKPEVVASHDDLRAYFRRAFDEIFHPVFDRSGLIKRYGTIEIVSEVEGAAIQLDDREVGKTIRGKTKLEAIASGKRKVVLFHPEFERMERTIEVPADASAKVEAALIPLPDPVVRYSRTALAILGGASAAAGASLVVYGVVTPKRRAVCVELSEGACSGTSEMARFGSPQEGRLERPNGSGPPILALGYSLIAMGATWSIGSLLFDSDRRMPWYELLAGAAVFGASMLLSYALDGENAIDAGRG